MKDTWFNITNLSPSAPVTIDITDEIGAFGISTESFRAKLAELKGREIILNVNSPGGSVEDGLNIYDDLREYPAKVTANIKGTAASMASVVILAADDRTISANGRVMMHRVTATIRGNPDQLDAGAKVARQYEDRIVAIYQERLGMSETAARDLMKTEIGSWFHGEQAVKAGFAHRVNTTTRAQAFKNEWAHLFTMLPAALFDNGQLTMSTPASPTPPAAVADPEIKEVTTTETPPPVVEETEEEETEEAEAETEAKAKGILARIAAAFSGDAAVKKELETVRASVTAKDTEIATLKAKVEALQPAADQLALIEAKLREAEANAKSVGLAAAEIAASHGLTPAKLAELPAPSDMAEPKTMTRAEFTALKSGEQAAFAQAGGTLID